MERAQCTPGKPAFSGTQRGNRRDHETATVFSNPNSLYSAVSMHRRLAHLDDIRGGIQLVQVLLRRGQTEVACEAQHEDYTNGDCVAAAAVKQEATKVLAIFQLVALLLLDENLANS